MDQETDERVIVSRSELEAVANGDADPADVEKRAPNWGRRAALAALLAGAGGAALGGQASAQTSSPSGTVGPAEEGIFVQITGDVAVDGVTISDLLNIQVYETESDIPDTLPANTIAVHG